MSTTLSQFEPGHRIGGYLVKRREPLEHLNGDYYELEHEPTGARHIHVSCPDDNKTFTVLFPTFPKDSSGVAHVLEHVVLAGSKNFPIRDPFFSMIKRSLATFLNAITTSAATLYPFSSRNEKDFFNLLDVYLDATLFPLITEDAFNQEGIRLEYEQPEDPASGLRFKGVVFNEMKAQMATPPTVVYRAIAKGLYPNLTYAYVSGGDPEVMPRLTWMKLRKFHATHYHPSNGYFFTYGDMSLQRVLERIESRALAHFDRIPIYMSIPDQKKFEKPKTVKAKYPLAKEEDPSKKSQVLIAWTTGKASDSFELITLMLLHEILMANDASPLRRALLTSGLGDALADGVGVRSEFRETAYAAGLKGVNSKDARKIEKLVLDTLEKLVKDGIDPEMVDAAIHQFEIAQREVTNLGFPYSLRLFFFMFPAYIYGGDPYRSLQFDKDIERVQRERSSGNFFEELIRRRLLDNSHRVRVVVEPDQELDDAKRAKESSKLSVLESKLSEKETQKILRRSEQLKALQDSKEDPSVLPSLELSDVPMTFEDVAHSIEEIAGARVGLFPQPTNGITYVDVRTDFSAASDDLIDYLGLFSYAVPRSGAGDDDHLKVASRIESYTGGVQTYASVRDLAEGESFKSSVTVSGKALTRNHEPFVSILKDLLTGARFEGKRLKELVAQLRAQMEASILPAGNQYAMLLAKSKISPSSAITERLSGVSQIALLKRLSELSEDDFEGVADKLGAIRDSVFVSSDLKVCVTAEDASLDELKQLVADAVAALPAGAAPKSDRKGSGRAVHEARTTSVPVNYNAKVFPTVGYTHPDSPPLTVLASYLFDTYLHREIREKGGAYGGNASFDKESGLFSFLSYRDPHITRTYSAYEEAIELTKKGGLDPVEINQSILQACRGVDPLLSADAKGRKRFFDDLAGYTLEIQSQYKQRLLDVNEDDLVRVAETYFHPEKAVMATIGNGAMIEQANKDMGHIFEVSPI